MLRTIVCWVLQQAATGGASFVRHKSRPARAGFAFILGLRAINSTLLLFKFGIQVQVADDKGNALQGNYRLESPALGDTRSNPMGATKTHTF